MSVSQLTNLGSSLSGNLPKAILCIRKISKSKRDILSGKQGETAASRALNTITAAEQALERSLDSRGSSERMKTFRQLQGLNDGKFHMLQVQYNPSSLMFNTMAGSYRMPQGAGEAGINQISQITMTAQTSMDMELVFDAVNNHDAFMWEKFRISTGDIQSSAMTLARHKNGYSVQMPVEGLLSLVTQAATRQVIFHWSDMTFAGELESISARYTMFSPSGKPVRAVVELSVRQKMKQTDDQNGGGQSPIVDDDYWNKAFTMLFGGKNNAGENTVVNDQAAIQNVSSMLNLNF